MAPSNEQQRLELEEARAELRKLNTRIAEEQAAVSKENEKRITALEAEMLVMKAKFAIVAVIISAAVSIAIRFIGN